MNLDHTFADNGQSGSAIWPGGNGSLLAQGDFDSGTLIAQFSIDGGTTWTALTGVSLTAAGNDEFETGTCLVRMSLSGATAPDITARLMSHGSFQ